MKIVPLTLREANDFVEQHHRHSARTSNDGGKFAIGLQIDGRLVGCAIVGRPIARLLQQPGTAEVLRCCVAPDAPAGACSKLYARCKRIWQQMGGTRIVTYVLATEHGGSVVGGGMAQEAEVKPGRWSRDDRPRRARAIEQRRKRRYGSALDEVPA